MAFTKKAPRISIVGLDGLSPNILMAALKKPGLPHLRRIVKNSFSRTLHSVPPTTPIGWTSIITGVNPAVHGIWGFTNFRLGPNSNVTSHLYNGYNVMAPRLWEMTALFDLKSLVINYPLTYPLKSLYLKNSTIFSDTLIGPRLQSHPKKLLNRFHRFFAINEDPLQKIKEMSVGITQLANELPWNLLVCLLDAPDKFFHKYPESTLTVGGQVKEAFESMDRLVGNLLDISDILFIVSDHGLAQYQKAVDPVALLYREEVLKSSSSLANKGMKRVINAIYGNRPLSALHPAVNKFFISKQAPLHFLFPKERSFTPRSRVFYDEIDAQDVCLLNFKRQRTRDEGYHHLARYDDLLDVYMTEKKFDGPHFPRFPSLFVVPKYSKGVCLSFSRSRSSLFSGLKQQYRISYNHHPSGVFIAYGVNIEPSFDFGRRVLPYDVVPTVLAMLNLPPPLKTNGRVLPLLHTTKQAKRYDYESMLKIQKSVLSSRIGGRV